jgi:hypothetical protein
MAKRNLKESFSLECCQDSLRDEEVKNRNKARRLEIQHSYVRS